MTDPTMDDAEEEALFARLKRGLELVRRDASLAQADGAVAPAGPDPDTTTALTRVEASLRTLAANVEALARRADGVDAAIEARVEATVARTAAVLRAEIERLSSTVIALSARTEAARPAARPALERTSPMPSSRRGFGIGRAIVAFVVALVLIGLGITAATRLGYGLDTLPIGRNLQERLSAWRSAWVPQPAPPRSEQAQASPIAPDPAAKPSVIADASAAPAPSANSAATSPAAAATPPPSAAAPPTAAAAAPPPPPPPLPAQAASSPTPAPAAAAAPAAARSTAAAVPAASPQDATQAAAPPLAPPPASRASEVTLRAKAPVWVEVRERKGRILLRRTLQAGETWSAPPDSQADLLLSAGNVRNLELIVDGSPQALPPSKGGVLRDVRIDNGA